MNDSGAQQFNHCNTGRTCHKPFQLDCHAFLSCTCVRVIWQKVVSLFWLNWDCRKLKINNAVDGAVCTFELRLVIHKDQLARCNSFKWFVGTWNAVLECQQIERKSHNLTSCTKPSKQPSNSKPDYASLFRISINGLTVAIVANSVSYTTIK